MEENGKIYITGLIGTYKDIVGVQLIDVIQQVKAQPNATAFDVYIKSEGGSVKEGFKIYQYLENLGLPINTYGDTLVASIATVIFMLGEKRYLPLNEPCDFMLHLPFGEVKGNADAIAEYGKYIKEIETFLVDYYVEKMGLPSDTVFALLESELWLTTEDCISLGIAESYQKETPIVAMADNNSDKSKRIYL